MRILLDVTRTLLHRRNPTPTGIDRVEHAFISRLLNDPVDDVHFVAMTPYATGALPRDAMKAILAEVDQTWGTGESGDIYEQTRAQLESPIEPDAARIARFGGSAKTPSEIPTYLSLFSKCLTNRGNFARLVAEAGRVTTLYVHTSHLQLEHSRLFQWTAARRIHAAFLIHDLIPIDYPEFCGVNTVAKHHRRMETVSAFGAALIANSRYTKDRLEAYLDGRGLRRPPIIVSHLGTELPEAEAGRQPRSPEGQLPYFLCVGTIEGRKNILHLFNVWRQMLRLNGPAKTPRLVIAGRRGWRCQNVLDVLDHSRELAGHVTEVADLKDVELTALMKGACAMLSPSLVEGYSLPPVEALGHHVPVIASDIPAHREVLGANALLLDPTDGPRWREAILAMANDPATRKLHVDKTLGFQKIGWQKHVDHALGQLVSLIGNPKPGQ